MLVRPKHPITELVATVRCNNGIIDAVLPDRQDKFIDTVKPLGYRWDGSYWQRRIGSLAGSSIDRAAELGRHLLAAGYVVSFSNETIRDLAVSGEYEPECKRWILAVGKGKFKGWMALQWGREDDFYQHVRRLMTGNRYCRLIHRVVIPPEQFQEVLDFAEIHDFRLSNKASAIVKDARLARESSLVVDVKIEEEEKKPYQRPKADGVLDRHFDIPHFDHPLIIKTDLYPHQQQAVDKVFPLRVGGLFMDMGTGKTRTAIELIYLRRRRISNIVWFCPVSLKETIVYEIQKHSNGGEIYVFDSETCIRDMPSAFWYIVGIESMSSSDRVMLAANYVIGPHSFVIVDESTYIKGHNSKRTKRITDIARRARYRLIMTGTPLTQGVVDLYAQLRFLSSDILGYKSFYSFAFNHLVYSEKYPGLIIRAHNTGWLAEKIEPYIYQVTKDECLDLPPKLYDARYFSMTNEQAEAYEKAKWDILMSAPDDVVDSYVIFQLFSALQQIVSGFWNVKTGLLEFEHERLGTLLDVVASIPEDEKIVIWCKFRYSVGRIAGALNDEYGQESVTLYYGDVNEKERNAELERFRGDARFFVATQATGGHGLDLTNARYVIFYENEFKYSNRIQAEDRCHRIGQDSPVTYIDIVCNAGIDKRINDALATKQNVLKSFRQEVGKIKNQIAGAL